MKQFYALIILCLFAGNIMAQQVRESEVNEKSEDGGVTWTNNYKFEHTYETGTQPTTSLKYVWDAESESWTANYKYDYTYDGNGYLSSQLNSAYDTNSSSYIPKYKYEYDYDANGYQTKFELYSSTDGGTTWVGSSFIKKWIKTYDNEGNLLTNEQYSWNATASAYIEDYKYEYSFDANGNQTSDASYTWDSDNTSWVGKSGTMKTVRAYDNKSNQLSEDQYGWGGSAWDILLTQRKTAYIYDENENITSATDSTYDFTTLSWIEDYTKKYKYELTYTGSLVTGKAVLQFDYLTFTGYRYASKYFYNYDTEGNVILIDYYIAADNTGTNWTWRNEENYAYDANGNKILEEKYKYDFATGDKIGDGDNYVYAYDDFGNEILNERYEWDINDSTWIGKSNTYNSTFKNVFEYNTTGDLETSYSGYIWDASGDWTIYSRTTYQNRDVATDVNDNLAQSKVLLYPNPTSGPLFIDNVNPNAHIAIYSFVGVLIKEVYSQQSRVSLNISDQPAGIYMVVAGNNTYKIIKK